MFLVVAATVVVVIRRALVYSLALAVCVAEGKARLGFAAAGGRAEQGIAWTDLCDALAGLGVGGDCIADRRNPIPYCRGGRNLDRAWSAICARRLDRCPSAEGTLVDFAVQILIAPVYAMALVLFYYDQRIRTEGYDIERMMEAAGLTKFASRLRSFPPASPVRDSRRSCYG